MRDGAESRASGMRARDGVALDAFEHAMRDGVGFVEARLPDRVVDGAKIPSWGNRRNDIGGVHELERNQVAAAGKKIVCGDPRRLPVAPVGAVLLLEMIFETTGGISRASARADDWRRNSLDALCKEALGRFQDGRYRGRPGVAPLPCATALESEKGLVTCTTGNTDADRDR